MRLVTSGEQPPRTTQQPAGAKQPHQPARPAQPPRALSGLAGLAAWAEMPPLQVFRQLESSPRGLAEDDAQERLAVLEENTLAADQPPGWARQLVHAAHDPFVMVLLALGVVSLAIGSQDSAAVISVLLIISVLLRFGQERRGGRAAAALRDLVATTSTVVRRASPAAAPSAREVPFGQVVPGDVVRLEPGDMVPADLRLLRSDSLTVS